MTQPSHISAGRQRTRSVIEVFDSIEQNTPAWFAVRAGMPTCSNFKHVMAKGRGGEDSKTRANYLYRLVDELIYPGDPVEAYTNEDLERGKILEAEACDIYALGHDVELRRVGFVVNHHFNAGCSPDRLISHDGILEVKTMFPRLWIVHVIKGTYPSEFTPQIQGMLWVTQRNWCDLMIYWPKRPPYIVRIDRDEKYIAELAKAVTAFNFELGSTVNALRTKLNLTEQLRASA